LRSIGRLDDPRRAGVLSGFLYAQGIENHVDEDDGVAIWVHDDAQLSEAKEHLAAFRDAPDDPRFVEGATAAKKLRRAEQAKDDAWRRRNRLARMSIHGADGRGWLTIALMCVSLVVAAVSNVGSDIEVLLPLLVSAYPMTYGFPEIAQQGELWRLVTPGVVHFGWMHLGFNLYMWWTFGQMVEVRKGFLFTTLLIVTAQLASGGAQVWWMWITEPNGYALYGGLSGVLYALFGYAWVKGRIDPADHIEVHDNTVYFLIGWLFLCMTGLLGNIANAAHLGGLVWGALYAVRAWFDFQKRRLSE
jgi:GlpG protein